jgi:hypothetical protein
MRYSQFARAIFHRFYYDILTFIFAVGTSRGAQKKIQFKIHKFSFVGVLPKFFWEQGKNSTGLFSWKNIIFVGLCVCEGGRGREFSLTFASTNGSDNINILNLEWKNLPSDFTPRFKLSFNFGRGLAQGVTNSANRPLPDEQPQMLQNKRKLGFGCVESCNLNLI